MRKSATSKKQNPKAAPAKAVAKAVAANGKIGIGIGINLEFVRHADKSPAYSINSAAKIGYEYVEPRFSLGRGFGRWPSREFHESATRRPATPARRLNARPGWDAGFLR